MLDDKFDVINDKFEKLGDKIDAVQGAVQGSVQLSKGVELLVLVVAVLVILNQNGILQKYKKK